MDLERVLVLPRCSTYLCGHCGCQLQKKAYERHKSLYYDSTTKQWIKKRHLDRHAVSTCSPACELSIDDDTTAMTEDDAMTEDLSESPPPLIDLEEPTETGGQDVDDVITEGNLLKIATRLTHLDITLRNSVTDHHFDGTEDCFNPSASDIGKEIQFV